MKKIYIFVALLLLGSQALISTAFAAPGFSDIQAVSGNFSATISYTTSVPSLDWIRYGTDTSFANEFKGSSYTTKHEITLSQLIPNTTYYYHIRTRDSKGNTSAFNPALYSTFYTSDSLTAKVLQDRLAQLQSQLNRQSAGPATTLGTSFGAFTRNLKVGDQGADVKNLQIFLNQDSRTQIAAKGLGSKGNETTFFGPATKNAVIRFQELYKSETLLPAGLSNGTGVVGVLTRSKLNQTIFATADRTNNSTAVATTPNQTPSYSPGGNGGGGGGSSPAPTPASPVPTPAPSPSPAPTPTPTPTPPATPRTYTITASAGAGGTISPSGVVSVSEGSSRSFSISPNAGYQIAGITVDGVPVVADTSYLFSAIASNRSINVVFSQITARSYAITASAGTGGTISPSGAVTVASGASQSFTITPNSGYQVASLLIDGVAVTTATTYSFTNVTANRTISVTFSPIVERTYTITASAGAGGSISPSGVSTVTAGTSKSFTITPNSGYQIASLLVDGTAVTAATSYTFPSISANRTISATFSQIVAQSYTITASAGTGGTISPSGVISVVSGTSKSFTITPNSGYQIATLVIDGASVASAASYTFTNVTANRTISATFSAIPAQSYTITASAGANGTISPSGAVTVASGASQSFTITPNSGYQIGTILVDGASVASAASYTFTNVTANRTISATFNAIVVTPPATPPSAKFVIGDRVQVSSGPLNVRAAAGGTLLGTQATGALGTIGSGPIATPGGNTTAPANWWGVNFDSGVDGWSVEDYLVKYVAPATPPTPPPAVSYTITASAGANGSISPAGAVTVASGASQSFTITPNSGYKIHTLIVDGVGVFAASPYVFTNVTANHTISAAFVAVPVGSYTITSNSGPNGYVSPQGSLTVPSGTNQAISIVANSGYKIADVLIDGVSIVGSGLAPTSYTFSNVTANHSLYATFEFTGVMPTPPPPPPSGITAQFDFDGSLANSAGSDVAVMRGGAPVFATINAQTSQKALVLDGVDDYVSIPSSAALNVGTGNFTASAWINPAKLKGGIHWRVLDKIGATGFTIDVVDMGGDQQPHIHFGAIDNNATKVDFYVAADFLANEWAMLTIVVNRSSRTVQFYQNATLIATENISALTGSLDTTEPFGIGLIPSLEGSAAYHKGLVAKVRLNKSAMSAAEIKTRFTAEDPTFQSFTDIVHTGPSPYNDFMRANARTVFGFKNMFYVNSDNYHANFRADQISSDFGFYNSGYGISVHAAVQNKATISNSSTAGGGLAGSNVGQLCLGTGYNGYEYVYGQAVRPNVPFQGVYPAVRDGGETNNTVYLPCVSKVAIPTTGHSSGEIKTGTTFARVAAAMPASVGQYLLQRGTIWSAVAAINEWSRNGKNSAALLGKNSTTYVLGSDETESRLMDMVQIANGMTVATTPPEARFTVTKSPNEPLIKGVNTYDDNTEVMFKTPQSAAFTARNLFTKTRVYEVDASASVAPTGATIAEYKWVLTWGDSSKVRITSLNQSGSQARIEIDWHGAEEVPSRYGAGIKSNMYIISLFVKSSTGVYSDSAVLTEYSMPNERRVYDASGKLTEAYFDWNVEGPGTGSGYSETSKFMVRKDFKNLYKYDAGGNLIGWTTKYLDDRFAGDFDARGYKVTYKADGVTIDTYQVPTYTVDSSGYLQTTYGPTQTMP